MALIAGLDQTYAALEADAQRLYRLLGLLPVRDISLDMAVAASSVSTPTAEWLLELLADAQLLDRTACVDEQTVRYRMARAQREHARHQAQLSEAETDRDDAVSGVCAWMLDTAVQARVELGPDPAVLLRRFGLPDEPGRLPFDDDAGALGWLASHQQNLPGILEASRQHGWHESVCQLVDAYWPFWDRRHPYELWIESHEVGVAAARQADNPGAVRRMLLSGAIGLAHAERWSAAIAWNSEALDAARTHGDVADEGRALLGLGICFHGTGQHDRARVFVSEAIGCWTRCPYPGGVELATIVLGEIALAENDTGGALSAFARAREGLLARCDWYDAARALALHGDALTRMGEVEEGIRELTDAVHELDAQGSTHWLARAAELLADACWQNNQFNDARRFYWQAADAIAAVRPADVSRLRQIQKTL